MRSRSPAADCLKGQPLRWDGRLVAGVVVACVAMLCFLPSMYACVEHAHQHSVWLGEMTKQGVVLVLLLLLIENPGRAPSIVLLCYRHC